jgi:RNA polymerase sigma factor for flagellar operon FliA
MTSDAELWGVYRRTRDRGLRDQLVERHLVLVKYAAARVASRLPSHILIDDLYSAGLLGFLRAVDDFDPDRGVEFGAYASQRIRGAIFDELRRLDWVPRGVRRRAREAERAIERLSQRLDRAPTDEEVAGELGIDVEDYQRSLGEGVSLLSLDAVASRDGDGNSVLDTVEDTENADPFRALMTKERRAILGRLIDDLPQRERQVLALYYFEELTMAEVGRVLGVTESRVSQLHSSAVLRLRTAVRRHRLGAREFAVPEGGSRGARAR